MTQDINIRIVRALRYHGGAEWNYRGIINPYNTLYFVTGGNGHIRVDDTITDMRPGYVYLIPLHLRHDLWCNTHVEKVYIDVHAELLPGYDVFGNTHAVCAHEIGLERCRQMHALCEGGIRERLILRSEVNLALAAFMREDPRPISVRMAAFLPMITYIQENLSAQLRRDGLAERFGWNPSVLSRSFKQVFGCGLKQYVEKLLTTRLAEELLLTNKPLHLLADQYGFCDGYYLSAYFKRSMGVSPLTYRKMRDDSAPLIRVP